MFVLGDYTVSSLEQQKRMLREKAELLSAGPANGEYHIDTPFTAKTEQKLLLAAGFASAEIVRSWQNAGIITAMRETN